MKKPLSIILCLILLLSLSPLIPAHAEEPFMIEQITCGMDANCYILSQGGSAVLIDTGTAAYRDEILQKCRAANVGLILITHGHYDHTQNAAFLAGALGVPIAMHPADLPLLTDVMTNPIAAHKLMGKVLLWAIELQQKPVIGPLLSRALNNEIPPFAPGIELYDGFSLEPYGVDARVIALPGHTKGSVGVATGNDLLVGDAMMNILAPTEALHYVDKEAMQASAAKIRGYEGATVWMGHGDATQNPAGVQIERIKCGFHNAYVVSQGGSAILVDTATSMYKNKILRACEGKNVRLIALTHGHYDHAQNAAFLSKALDVPVAMHPADLPLLTDILAEPLQGTDPISNMLIGFLEFSKRPGFQWIGGIVTSPAFDVTVELGEGFSFRPYGVDAYAIELPGHSSGSIGIVTPAGLIAGDALTNLFPPAGKAALYSDWEAVEASAAKAAALGDITVYFGHGNPAGNRAW